MVFRKKKTAWGILAAAVLTGVCLGIMAIVWTASTRPWPSFQDVRTRFLRDKSDALLLDRHGTVIHELRVGFQGRRLRWTPLPDISPVLRSLVVSSEDQRFYTHSGVDWLALFSASFGNVFFGGSRGASTITMQLASLLSPDLKPHGTRRSFLQKLRQIGAAKCMERMWSKEQILEAYLNLISFRGELQGIAAASRGLFGKSPSGLDAPESLILVSLVRSPNASPKDIARRACRMARSKLPDVSPQSIRALAKHSLSGPYRLKARIALAPHVAKRLLGKGKTSAFCTIHGSLQRFVREILRHHMAGLRKRNVCDAAALVLDNRSGQVLAYVGNTGSSASAPFVDGIRARRQAGSTLKPFLYGLALENRILTPASLLDDSPLHIPMARGIYSPGNYDNRFRGLIPVRIALAASLNVPAVRTLSLIGEDPFLQKMADLGFKCLRDGDYYGLALALGTADVSLWELANAYRTLANKGIWNPPTFHLNHSGAARRRVFSHATAFLISDILSDRGARSITFGLENPLATQFWSAVKTGTSMDMRDNWCIGYSNTYTVGVWAGNFSGEPMWNVSGMTGAAPIWFEIMNHLHHGAVSHPPRMPKGVVERTLRFAAAGFRFKERFLKGTEKRVLSPCRPKVRPKILYPPHNAILALDPDIPAEQQRVAFRQSKNTFNVTWVLNQKVLGRGPMLLWKPDRGSYRLSLVTPYGKAKDTVAFSVR